MSDIKTQLVSDMKSAMKSGEKTRLQTIRSINATIKQFEVDEQTTATDTHVLSILEKLAKQRKDSLAQYETAGREDLAEVERQELAIIQDYLPAQLDDTELQSLIQESIQETGASGMKDMGALMANLKPKLAGRADMGRVSQLVKTALN